MTDKMEYENPEAGAGAVTSGMIMESEIKISTKISVYMDDGRVFEYFVSDPVKAREHVSKIIATGYRSTPMNTNDLEWFPPHRIDKVKIAGGGESTKYRDVVRST